MPRLHNAHDVLHPKKETNKLKKEKETRIKRKKQRITQDRKKLIYLKQKTAEVLQPPLVRPTPASYIGLIKFNRTLFLICGSAPCSNRRTTTSSILSWSVYLRARCTALSSSISVRASTWDDRKQS